MTIGDQDRFFTLKDASATEAALRAAGFPVTLDHHQGTRSLLYDRGARREPRGLGVSRAARARAVARVHEL